MTKADTSTTRFPRLRPLTAGVLIILAAHGPNTGHARTAAAQARDSANAAATTVAVVANCNDSGPGSLRDAFSNAVDGVTIDLTQLTCSRVTLTTGALTDAGGAMESGDAGVTLKGSGQVIDGGNNGRVIVHNGADLLTIHDLTVVNGTYNANSHGGGCIFAYGAVTLEGSTVSNCTLTSSGGGNAFGGAIYSRQRVYLSKNSAVLNSKATATKYGAAAGGGVWAHGVTVNHSLVMGNTAVGDKAGSRGGGIFATYSASQQAFGMAYSTVSGNSANAGGGVYVYGDTRVVYSTISANQAGGNGGGMFVTANLTYAFTHLGFLQSTISGNKAGSNGGGIFIDGAAAFVGCTITNNSAAASGGGAYLEKSPQFLYSTLIANNLAAGNPAGADLSGMNTSIDGGSYYNLIRASTLTVPSDTLTADPMLGPLQDNGGPTFTHALLEGSPAIDSGSYSPTVLTDQRGHGFPRVVGVNADIGAFERQEILFKNGFEAGP